MTIIERFFGPQARPVRSTVWLAVIVGLSGALGAGPALAGDPTVDKSPYGLLDPTPDGALRSFSPDRPLNALTPFTVDAGRIVVESDVGDFTRASDGSTTTRTFETLDPLIRIGVTSSLEFDVATAGLLTDQTSDKGSGRRPSREIGTGPVLLRATYNLFGNDGGPAALSLLPFLMVPSGDRHFSDPRIEGGLIAPLNLNLPSDFDLVLETEVQSARETGGRGYASFTNLANLSHPIPGIDKLSGAVEFTSVVNADRHVPDVYTADFALTYLLDTDTQLDIGAFIGLNRDAPDYQVAGGIAHRF